MFYLQDPVAAFETYCDDLQPDVILQLLSEDAESGAEAEDTWLDDIMQCLRDNEEWAIIPCSTDDDMRGALLRIRFASNLWPAFMLPTG